MYLYQWIHQILTKWLYRKLRELFPQLIDFVFDKCRKVFIKVSADGKAFLRVKKVKGYIGYTWNSLAKNCSRIFNWKWLLLSCKHHDKTRHKYIYGSWSFSIFGNLFCIFMKINSWQNLFQTIELMFDVFILRSDL